MGALDDLKEKAEGEADKIKGDLEGGIKGGVSKIKGNVKSADADSKMRARSQETETPADDDNWADDTI